MFKKLLSLILTLVIATAFAGFNAAAAKADGSDLYAFRWKDKWGYMDKTGKVVIQPQFAEARQFSEGRAVVGKPKHFETHDLMKYGYIDVTGKLAIPYAYHHAGDYENGVATAVKWDPDFDRGYEVEDGLNTNYYLRPDGTCILTTHSDIAYDFSDGRVVVFNWDYEDCFDILDENGKSYLKYDESIGWVYGFSEGLAAFQKDEKLGYLDVNGKMVIKNIYEAAGYFSEGLALFSNDPGEKKKYGFIDKTGAVKIPPQFEEARAFSHGLAAVMQNGKWGFIDKTGTLVIPCEFDNARSFSGGYAAVQQGNKRGFIDKTGNIVLPPKYKNVRDVRSGLVMVTDSKENYMYYVDLQGNIVSAKM